MNILLCSTPVHGHVTPLLAVSRAFVERGHRVFFLTGARYAGRAADTGATVLPLPAEADYDDTDMDAAFPGRVGLTGPAGIRYDMRAIFLAPAHAQLTAVDAAIARHGIDVVLAESLFLGAALLTARPRASRPAVLNLGIVPLGLKSRHTAPFGLGVAPKPGPAGRLRNAALTLVAEKAIFAPVQKEARLIALETGAPLGGFILDWPSRSDGVVQFTVPSFEYPRPDVTVPVHFVGPVSRTQRSDTPLPAWWGDLADGRPIVHVTQGTVANRELGDLVLPTIRALAGADVWVVASTGGRPVVDLGESLPANARVAPYLPYDELLPRTAVYVTNGGYGGVHYAMEHGVPIVIAGTTEDKTEVSARVAWTGVGVSLRTNRPTQEAIADAVLTVLADRRYAEASARIGADIRSSSGLDGVERAVVAACVPGATPPRRTSTSPSRR
ncbi:glycosyltransferase [Leifsonia aquatica]|uniref:Glycosyltransferase, MGT family n=2 Tax=Leifsonia aquatica TaxID=144185 RepID=U2T521_LEIAQ|nr:nucleotide disphospho-sugar-binding domain-containing protein [Leifsonia aquatica]ERK72578.1 glycosyltransferase, MGT family [Leifsonia aquatica ATCC 14665]MBB2967052.1 UDP:flavonoid glycosyltransferase YjiC (YdhE family) [Leifsonia aquatica]